MVDNIVTSSIQLSLIPNLEPLLDFRLLELLVTFTSPNSLLFGEWLVVHVVELQLVDKWSALNNLVLLACICGYTLHHEFVLEEQTATVLFDKVPHVIVDCLLILTLRLLYLLHDHLLSLELFLKNLSFISHFYLEPLFGNVNLRYRFVFFLLLFTNLF